MATRNVPEPQTLREAVQEVIHQNRSVGYIPSEFITITENGYADDLVTRCTSLVNSPDALLWVYSGVENYPEFLSLEDMIILSPHGGEWGFDEATLAEARQRHEAFTTTRQAKGYTTWTASLPSEPA